jgi:hypothetical protein
VQIAAIAFAVLLIVAMAVGCAKYDGDQAAFCAQLDDVPSFMQLSAKVSTGSATQAAATMKGAAGEFRTLERLAPRSIRATVAALGDAAERIEANLASESGGAEYVTLQNDDGSTTRIPITTSPSQARLGVFYDEMQNHHGTVSAVYALMTYGRDTCGITEGALDLGMFGYGPSAGFGDGGPVTVPGLQTPNRTPGQDPAPVEPSPGSDPTGGAWPRATTSTPGGDLAPPATSVP